MLQNSQRRTKGTVIQANHKTAAKSDNMDTFKPAVITFG